MSTLQTSNGQVHWREAWTSAEVHRQVAGLLAEFEHQLPPVTTAIVVKPNLNNDLIALTGNSTDLRVLDALFGCLRQRGFRDITVADGSNVGVHRRGINTAHRLRVDRLAARHDVRVLDLNQDAGDPVAMAGGAVARVARAIVDGGYVISVPTIKTHAEMGLSCALKNWVGITVGQDKREIHKALAKNIIALHEVRPPDLVLVDGLIGMEGNGPGDGHPFRLGRVLASDSAVLIDLVVGRMVNLDWQTVPYLRRAFEKNWFDVKDAAAVRQVSVVRPIEQAPTRSMLAAASEHRVLYPLKKAVRPFLTLPGVTEAAYRLRVIQDVYSAQDDGITGVRRLRDDCGECTQCADFCPTGLSVADIGKKTTLPDCVGCAYCWWVCPDDVIELVGEVGGLQRQVRRYRPQIRRLAR